MLASPECQRAQYRFCGFSRISSCRHRPGSAASSFAGTGLPVSRLMPSSAAAENRSWPATRAGVRCTARSGFSPKQNQIGSNAVRLQHQQHRCRIHTHAVRDDQSGGSYPAGEPPPRRGSVLAMVGPRQTGNSVETHVLRGESYSSPVGARLFGGKATPKVASLLRARSSSNLRINAAGSVKRT